MLQVKAWVADCRLLNVLFLDCGFLARVCLTGWNETGWNPDWLEIRPVESFIHSCLYYNISDQYACRKGPVTTGDFVNRGLAVASAGGGGGGQEKLPARFQRGRAPLAPTDTPKLWDGFGPGSLKQSSQCVTCSGTRLTLCPCSRLHPHLQPRRIWALTLLLPLVPTESQYSYLLTIRMITLCYLTFSLWIVSEICPEICRPLSRTRGPTTSALFE